MISMTDQHLGLRDWTEDFFLETTNLKRLQQDAKCKTNLQANICCGTTFLCIESSWFSSTEACTRVTRRRAVGVSRGGVTRVGGWWSDRRCRCRDDFHDGLRAALEGRDVGSRWETVWFPIHVRPKATSRFLILYKLFSFVKC